MTLREPPETSRYWSPDSSRVLLAIVDAEEIPVVGAGRLDRVGDRVDVHAGLVAGEEVVEPAVQLLDRRAGGTSYLDQLQADTIVVDGGVNAGGDSTVLVPAIDERGG